MRILRVAVVAAVALCGGLARAQTAEAPRLTGIAHVAIRVADLEKSRTFYQSLGYTQPFTMEKDGKVIEAFIKLNDRQYLELYPADAEHPAAFLHVCFEAVNLTGLYPLYAARGVVAPPVRKAGAGNMLMAWKGPEGQTEEITEYMPGSRHSNDFGKDLGGSRVSQALIAAVVAMQDPKAAAEYFVLHMGFVDDGVHEGAIVISPPGVKDASLGLLPASADVKLALVFAVESESVTLQRLKKLTLQPSSDARGVTIADPDGNLLVFRTRKR